MTTLAQAIDAVSNLTATVDTKIQDIDNRVDTAQQQVDSFIAGARSEYPAINMFNNAVLDKVDADTGAALGINFWKSNISITTKVIDDPDRPQHWWWRQGKVLEVKVSSNDSSNTKYGSIWANPRFQPINYVPALLSFGFEYKIISKGVDDKAYICWESPSRQPLDMSEDGTWKKARLLGVRGVQGGAFISFYMGVSSTLKIQLRDIFIAPGYVEEFSYPIRYMGGLG